MESPKIHRVLGYADKEGIPGWWTFRLMSATPQSAWDVPQERDVDNKILCFTYVELEKNVTSYEIFEKFSYVRVLLIDGGAVKKNTWPQYEKKHTWYTTTRNHVFQLEQRSRGP